MKIIFVCHGNICRSPMAEFVMKDAVKKEGLTGELEISSAATSDEEIGNPVHRGAAKKLFEHGISCAGKRAARITEKEMAESDLIIIMDEQNRYNLKRLARRKGSEFANDVMEKTHLLLDFAYGGEVADPWYTGDFDATWNDVAAGCAGLIEYIKGEAKC